PTRAVTVTIDTYDEAELELALMILSLPAAARFILDNLKKHPKENPAAKPPDGLKGDPSTPLLPPPLRVHGASPD
ncbi:hypothetical protein KAT55_00705, partial [Candidatus Bathyarchaeota archaeon]|nr:hypothetical protein [Candidatus Bathyarchaeota archaeon]